MKFRRLICLVLTTLFLLIGCALADGENLLRNPGFETLDSDGMPADWTTEAYRQMIGYTVFDINADAHTGETSVRIENIGMNDARFAQKVQVQPNTIYRLSGWVKAEDIADSGHGANLSIADIYVFSRSLYATDGWEYVECYGLTGPEQNEITVFARVGGYSGESIGAASFDDISLEAVDRLPVGAVAVKWYSEDVPIYDVEEEEDLSIAKPFWPWLIVLSVISLCGAYLMKPYMLDRAQDLTKKKDHAGLVLLLGLLSSYVLRLVISVLVEGYGVDVGCFVAWGDAMAKYGPTGFYQATNFCDYPPAYLYVLAASSVVGNWLQTFFGRPVLIAAFKFVPMTCDIACALLVYMMANRCGATKKQAALIGTLTAWSPILIMNSAAWCQMDSVLCLMLLGVAYLAIMGRWDWLFPLYMLSVLVKPQALMLGPLGLLAAVMVWLKQPEMRKKIYIGLAGAVVVALVILIPFSVHQSPDWIITLYSNTLASYPQATLNTANLYYLAGGNWDNIANPSDWLATLTMAAMCIAYAGYLYKRQKSEKLGTAEPIIFAGAAAVFGVFTVVGASWAVVGGFAMVMCFVVVMSMYVRGGDIGKLPLMGGLLFLLLYVLGIKMHERYLMPGIVLFAMAFAMKRDVRILRLLMLITVTMFINEGIILDNAVRLGANMGHLNDDTYLLNMILSLLNTLAVPYAVKICHQIMRNEPYERRPKAELKNAPAETAEPVCHALSYKPDASLHWKRLDWIFVLTVTLVYSVVALCNLGSTKAPQNPWQSTTYEEQVVIDLGQDYDKFNMLYFAQVSYDTFTVATSDDGENWSEEITLEMAQGQCFRWKYATYWSWMTDANGNQVRSYNTEPVAFSGRYVRISAQQVGLILNEVIFRDAEGNTIPATAVASIGANESSPLYTDINALLDEQDTLEGEPSWYNSTYFDEIYHARTAFEHLNGTVPYETTHPPLGKVIMSWSIALFGMTPFGWRFAGAFMGILMVPVMYLLGKQLTKRTDVAFAAMCLMTLDCMHLTQTRIATIDSFPVLFIMVSYLFMLRFMQRDIAVTPMKKLIPDLALSGFAMGCAVASKWIGAYAGIGLAVLFFWTLVRHIRLSNQAELMLMNSTGLAKEEVSLLKERVALRWRRPIILCCWCLLFFVAVPVLIYLLSYIPHFAYRGNAGLGDFLKSVIQAQEGMLSYHATPGLGMDHPFYSPWYEWPLNQRPMYYANSLYQPAGYDYAIFCFGNPAVWTGGLIGILYTVYAWAKRHQGSSAQPVRLIAGDTNVATAFVLIGLLAQFLPWVLVPRGTYIYHYFASIPFLCLGAALLLHDLIRRKPLLGKIVLAVFILLALGMFVAYYPYASGVLTPVGWLDFMRRFLRIYY